MKERIERAVSCKDCKDIPKVENSGQIVEGYQIMHNGLKIYPGCYHGGWMTELISKCDGHHEPQEERAFYEVLKRIREGSTMVEIGSFWAYYSMWFNFQIKNSKNYMVDVDEEVLNIGKKNFELNNLSGKFFIGQVPNFKFGEFLDSNGIEFVDILHSDIQGWEYHLLEECSQYLDRIGYIFVSTHTDQGTPGSSWRAPRELLHEDCLQFLIDKGFVILCEHNMRESASHDGLIVAKNPNIDLEFKKIEISKWS